MKIQLVCAGLNDWPGKNNAKNLGKKGGELINEKTTGRGKKIDLNACGCGQVEPSHWKKRGKTW